MDTFLFDPKFHRLADFLGVDKYKRDDPKLAQKVAFLSDWAEDNSKSDDFPVILKTLIGLKKDLGTTLRGETLVRELYKWTRLDADSKRIEQQKASHQEMNKAAKKEETELKKRILERTESWKKVKDEPKKINDRVESRNVRKNEKVINSLEKQGAKLRRAGTRVTGKLENPTEEVEVQI